MGFFKSKSMEDGAVAKGLSCRKCGSEVPVTTLSIYGAQCGPCYFAYCRETPRNYRAGMPDTPTVADMKSRLKGRIGNIA